MANISDYRTADPYEAAAIRCAEASERLWARTGAERVAAMRRGELTPRPRRASCAVSWYPWSTPAGGA